MDDWWASAGSIKQELLDTMKAEERRREKCFTEVVPHETNERKSSGSYATLCIGSQVRRPTGDTAGPCAESERNKVEVNAGLFVSMLAFSVDTAW